MGYRRPAKVYNIIWDEGDLAGLEVRIDGLSVGQMLELGKVINDMPDDLTGSLTGFEPLITGFSEALIEWNLEDEVGKPVSATIDGVKQQDLSFIIPVIMRWMASVASVMPPLPETSNSGETAPEESLALATSSASLPS